MAVQLVVILAALTLVMFIYTRPVEHFWTCPAGYKWSGSTQKGRECKCADARCKKMFTGTMKVAEGAPGAPLPIPATNGRCPPNWFKDSMSNLCYYTPPVAFWMRFFD